MSSKILDETVVSKLLESEPHFTKRVKSNEAVVKGFEPKRTDKDKHTEAHMMEHEQTDSAANANFISPLGCFTATPTIQNHNSRPLFKNPCFVRIMA